MSKTALAQLLEKGRLVPCQVIANCALAGEQLPARLKLFNWGANERIDGPPIVVNGRTLSSLAANQAALGFDRIAVDYNHQSVKGHPNFVPDPREHAAFGAVEVVPNDGIYLTSLSWTPSGEKNARNYADLSPTPLLDPETNEVLFLHSVALCTQGKVKGLSFFSADFLAPLSAATPATHTQTQKTASTMDPKKLLCAILGLDPATATDDEITAAAEKFGKQEKTEASPDMTALSADVKGLLKRLDEQEKANLLRDAIRAGKLVPQSVRDLPLESFRTVVKDLPENVVPLSARTPENLTALATATPESAATAEVARQLGLDPKSLTEAAA